MIDTEEVLHIALHLWTQHTIDSLWKTAYHVKIPELFRVKINCLESCTFITLHGDYFFSAYA